MHLVQPFQAAVFLLTCAGNVHAQTLTPQVIATAGGTHTAAGVQLDQTIGEVMSLTWEVSGTRLNQGFQQAEPVRLRLNMRAFLQGPFNEGSGTMGDALRSAGYLPMSEPYTALGYAQVGGGGEQVNNAVFSVAGSNAVVDWIHLQLRDAAGNTTVVATRNALLQRDGDVVDIDGFSPVAFAAPPGSYFLSVHHRNHLGVMTATTIALSPTAASVDLTDGSSATHGTDAQQMVGTVRVSWAGDVTGDGSLKYTGVGNDRDPMLVTVGSTTPNNTVTGYRRDDVNMDGTTKYTGASNDRDVILPNIGSTTPNNIRSAQLP